MNILKNVLQGTKEWLSIRASHFTASEAPAAFGVSLYLNRNELLQQKATGKCKEISDFQQSVFDKGHEAEASARAIAEDIVGEDLCAITATLNVDNLKLLASYDGATFGNNIIWEHKLWSEELAQQIEENNINEHYSIQLDQQLLISSAEKCLFMTSDGTVNNCKWMWYETTDEKKDAVISTWKQFKKDLEMYEQKEFDDKPEPAAIMQLPALSVYTKGDIAVHGNLDAFKEASDKYIASINKDLKTDEDFVNAEAAIKRCKEVEQTIKTAKSAIIGGISSVDEATRVLDYIDDSHAKIRLTLEKLVKSQKENIKKNIIDAAFMLCADHANNISSEFKNISFLHLVTFFSRQNFETECKGLRTLASLHNAVDTEVAAIKIKLNDLAMIVRKNLSNLPDDLSIFRDLQSIITKPEEDFKLLVESRIADQKRKEEEATQRAVSEAKAREEAEAARITAAQERIIKLKEEESKRIASLPTDIKSVLADEKKQAELIVREINKSPDQLTGFHKWWRDVGRNITGDRMFLAKSAWDAYKDESSK